MVLVLAAAFSPTAEAVILNGDGSPVASDPHLLAWYKADSLSGLGDGDAVLTWTDSSDNGNDTTGRWGSPTYKAGVSGVLGGMPSVTFDGNDSFGTAVIPATGADPRTLIVVINNRGTNGIYYEHVLHYGSASLRQAY